MCGCVYTDLNKFCDLEEGPKWCGFVISFIAKGKTPVDSKGLLSSFQKMNHDGFKVCKYVL